MLWICVYSVLTHYHARKVRVNLQATLDEAPQNRGKFGEPRPLSVMITSVHLGPFLKNRINLLIQEAPLAETEDRRKMELLGREMPHGVWSTVQDASITDTSSWKEPWLDDIPGASLLMQLNSCCPDVVAGERGKDPSLRNGAAFGMIRWHQVLIPIMP